MRFMKVKILLALSLLSGICFAQIPTNKQWDYRYGGNGVEVLSGIVQTSDHGYILGGSSTSDSSGDKTQPAWDQYGGWDYWIVKIDSLGKKQWDKRFGGTRGDLLYSLSQTFDEGYILAGNSDSDSSGDKTQNTQGDADYWIVKTDANGNKQWDKRFGGKEIEALYSIAQTTDHGFILGGVTMSDSSGDVSQSGLNHNRDFWIVKIDSAGNKQWDIRFGGNHWDVLYSLKQTMDGGYILGGSSQSDSSGQKSQNTVEESYDFWIVKIDATGVIQWDKDFGGAGDDELYSLCQTPDGGYLLAGTSNSGVSGNKTQYPAGGAGDFDFWIVKTDSLGNKIWDKDFGGTLKEDEFGNVSVTSDGGYLLAGTSYSDKSGDKSENNLANEQSWFVKIDSLGNKQWDKTLLTNQEGDDEIGLAIQTTDGCYVFANYTDANAGGDKTQLSQGSTDYWVTRFCNEKPEDTNDDQIEISVWPNPSNGSITVTIQNGSGEIELQIVNALGQILLAENFLVTQASMTKEVNLENEAQGIYFIRIISNTSQQVKSLS